MEKFFLDQVEVGPVAQRIRARGYEPRCRGFESLLAHCHQEGILSTDQSRLGGHRGQGIVEGCS